MRLKKTTIKKYFTEIPWFNLSLIVTLIGLLQFQRAYYIEENPFDAFKIYFVIFFSLWIIGWISFYLVVQSELNIKSTLKKYRIPEVK